MHFIVKVKDNEEALQVVAKLSSLGYGMLNEIPIIMSKSTIAAFLVRKHTKEYYIYTDEGQFTKDLINTLSEEGHVWPALPIVELAEIDAWV